MSAKRAPRRPPPAAVTRLIEYLVPLGAVTARAMFGGYGIYLDGTIFAIAAGEQIFFKIDDTSRARYEAAGMSVFRPFDDHTVLRSYYEVPPTILGDGGSVREWAAEAHRIARQPRATKARRRLRPGRH